MNFYNHLLTESMNYSDIADVLNENCTHFIKEMKRSRNFLFRLNPAYAPKYDMDIIVASPRKDRRPTDTPQGVHIEMDDMLKTKFGWKPRSQGMFVWIGKQFGGDSYWIHNYKNARIVLPAGLYRYVYSPRIKDIYNKYEDVKNYAEDYFYSENDDGRGGYDGEPPDEEDINQKFLDWFWEEGLSTYTNKDFGKLDAKNDIEMMLSAPVVYLVSPRLIPLLNDLFSWKIDERKWQAERKEVDDYWMRDTSTKKPLNKGKRR